MVDERGIDRRFLEHLIARHGAPRPPPRLTPEEQERSLRIERRDRAMAAADPELVHHVERHQRSSELLTWAQRVAGESITHPAALERPIGLDWDAAGLRDVGQIRELEPSEELHDLMEHKTPQAFLRDLHRPVQKFGDVVLHRRPAPSAGAALERAREVVRDAMSHRAGAAAAIELASQAGRAGMEELRALMARPWEESRPANPLPMPSRTPSVQDMLWFGLSGGYDPDL